MKIAILGTSGSGKSTLAKRLGERYGLPVLHMDTVHFLPGWVERPFAEEEAIVRQFLDENAGGWVIDGNYSKTCYARRLEEADKIIVLWFSPLVCLWRAIRRWQQNKGRVRESSAPGCEEKIDAEFVRWILHDGRTSKSGRRWRGSGKKYPEKYVMIQEPAGAGWVLEGTLNWFSRRWRGAERVYAGLSSLCVPKREPEKHPLLRRREDTNHGLLALIILKAWTKRKI